MTLSANLSKSRSARRQKAQSKHEDNQTAGTEEIAALRESFITCLETAHAILDFEGLAKNLGTCLPGSTQFTLNSQAFSLFLSILSPASLVAAFDRVDIDLNWDQLGRTKAVQDAVEKKETRDAAKALQDFLQDFSKKRNKIAHAGGSSIVVLESDFSALVNVFRIIARSLATLVEAEIEKAIRQGRV